MTAHSSIRVDARTVPSSTSTHAHPQAPAAPSRTHSPARGPSSRWRILTVSGCHDVTAQVSLVRYRDDLIITEYRVGFSRRRISLVPRIVGAPYYVEKDGVWSVREATLLWLGIFVGVRSATRVWPV